MQACVTSSQQLLSLPAQALMVSPEASAAWPLSAAVHSVANVLDEEYKERERRQNLGWAGKNVTGVPTHHVQHPGSSRRHDERNSSVAGAGTSELVAAVLPLYTGSRRTLGEPRDARAYGVGYGPSTSCRAERDNPTMSTSTSPADGQRSIAPSSRDAEAVSTRTRGRHSCSALRGELEGRPATAAARTSKVDSARRQERPRSSRSGGAALLTVTELFEMGESRHFDARAPLQYLAPQRQHP